MGPVTGIQLVKIANHMPKSLHLNLNNIESMTSNAGVDAKQNGNTACKLYSFNKHTIKAKRLP